MWFSSYLPDGGLLSILDLLVDVFNQMQRHFSQYFLSSFFCRVFSFLSFWGSNYMYVGGLDTVPQVTGNLFIGLVFSCINASGWRISIDLSINSLFLYLLCSIYSISSTNFSYVRCCIFFIILGFLFGPSLEILLLF